MLGSVHQHLAEQYVEPRDPKTLLHTAIQGMVKGLADPYTQFLGPDSLVRFEEESTGTLIGIGIVMFESGKVHYPLVNGPAELAGIRPGDQILSIDGNMFSITAFDPVSVGNTITLIKVPKEIIHPVTGELVVLGEEKRADAIVADVKGKTILLSVDPNTSGHFIASDIVKITKR